MRLATRIVLLISVITMLMGLLTIFFSAPIVKDGMRTMDHEWVKSLTGALSEGIANDTINGNATRVRQIMDAVVFKNSEIEYAYVIDFEQRIFAHTFKNGFPKKVFDIAKHNYKHSHSIRGSIKKINENSARHYNGHLISFQLDGKKIEDISYPIIEGMSARLHLGLGEESDNVLLENINQKFIFLILILGLIGVVIAFPLSRQLTKPLENLGKLMQSFGSGENISQFELPKGSIEVNKLGSIFKNVITELEENQNLFAAMFESLSDAVVVADTERRMTIVNKSTKNQFGYDEHDLLGNATSMLYAYPDDFKQTGKQRYHVDAKGDPLPYEIEYKRKDGSIFLGETLGTKIISKDGTVFGFVGIIRDITKRKNIEQTIRLSEQRLNNAQHLAKLGSWELKLESNVLIWSDEIFNIFDIDKNKFEASFEAFLDAIHPEDKDEVNQAYATSLETRQPYEIIHRLLMKDGSIKHVRETCESFFDDDNKPLRSVGTVQDITEIVVAQDELEKHHEQLEELVMIRTKELHNAQDELVRKERLATLGQLTATVSHELRNPLGAMRPSLYVIEKTSDQNDERLQNAIQRVDRNINRCDKIIDELLDFTRITELNRESTCIDQWLDSVINEQFIPNGILVVKDFRLKDIELNIDTGRLRRAVINVVENACHSMMDDNQKLVKKEHAELTIKSKNNNNRVEIIIKDKGTGITDKVLEKIFEPLYSTKGFGVGLGMPTVKQIMEQHDGGVEIKSEKGKGSSITLWLPINKKSRTANGKSA